MADRLAKVRAYCANVLHDPEPNFAAALKKCTRCGEVKPLVDFARDGKEYDGRFFWCQECHEKYHEPLVKVFRHPVEHAENKEREPRLAKGLAYKAQYGRNEKGSVLQVNASNYWVQRQSAIDRLGGKCCRCGFEDIRALQIDHINSDGAGERQGTKGAPFYVNKRVLEMSEAELHETYQVLCANCNWIKRYEEADRIRELVQQRKSQTKRG